MKTISGKFLLLLFLINSLFVCAQIKNQTIKDPEKDLKQDSIRDLSIEGLSIQEIRKAVYGFQYYKINDKYTLEQLDVDKIPVMRDSLEMKKKATTPALYLDSLIYENILDGPLLNYQELLLNRFPYLIMNNMSAADKIMKIMDSLSFVKPDITKEEYWLILKRDYADILGLNFKWLNEFQKNTLSKMYPYRKIRNIIMVREVFNTFAPITQNNVSIKTKPYLEKLGALPPDSSYFVVPNRRRIINKEDMLR